MAWTESGLCYATIRDGHSNIIALDMHTAAGLSIALSNNSDTPAFQADPATWSTTNEVHDAGTWPSGGVSFTTANGGGSLTPTFTVTGTPPTTNLKWALNNVSVANTTLTTAYGCYLYASGLTPKAILCAVWFGGSPYSTVAGTFAITWSASGVITMALAA